jgi:hypothetical protein
VVFAPPLCAPPVDTPLDPLPPCALAPAVLEPPDDEVPPLDVGCPPPLELDLPPCPLGSPFSAAEQAIARAGSRNESAARDDL